MIQSFQVFEVDLRCHCLSFRFGFHPYVVQDMPDEEPIKSECGEVDPSRQREDFLCLRPLRRQTPLPDRRKALHG